MVLKLTILYLKVSISQDGKVTFYIFNLTLNFYINVLIPIFFSLDMLITCIGTTLLAFLFFTVTFCKELLHSSISAQHQGQAFMRDAQLLQVLMQFYY